MNNPQFPLPSSIESFINQDGFPCVGAKIALNKSQITTLDFKDIRSDSHNQDILSDIYRFIKNFNKDKKLYSSLVCTFKHSSLKDEKDFELVMWDKLQKLHNLDSKLYSWDKRVSCDPNDSQFSFSLGGEAFFIIGLSPYAQRKARRFKYPAIVFNLHSQFQVLKETNKFNALRVRIRKNEEAFSGSPNPNLYDHGVVSEARQYSGRSVDNHWQCPFSTRSKK